MRGRRARRRLAGHRDRTRLLDGAGRLGDPADGDCLLVEARDADGNLIALLSFVPWGPDGVSLDLMRRDRTAPNGVMEFMVAELCAGAGQLGVRRVSLNFAVFRSAFEEGARIGAGPVLRALAPAAAVLLQVVAAGGALPLQRQVPPRVVTALPVLRASGALARVGIASGIAEGFVAVPSLGKPCGARANKKQPAGPGEHGRACRWLHELGLVQDRRD